jgi:hypothetical protein
MTTLTPFDAALSLRTQSSYLPLTTLARPEPCSLHRSPADCHQTVPILLILSWATQQKSTRSVWMKETNKWRREQLLIARRHMDRLRRSTLTVTVAPMKGSTAIAPNNVLEEREKHVSSPRPSGPASLTKSSVWDAGSPCTTADATHSQSSFVAPMMWKELMDHVAEARPHSDAATAMKKLLQFKMKEGRTTKRLKKLQWRYALPGEALREDRRRVEEEEHALLLHDVPLTRSKFHAYRRSSGSMYPTLRPIQNHVQWA